jgi:hypothetical protein
VNAFTAVRITRETQRNIKSRAAQRERVAILCRCWAPIGAARSLPRDTTPTLAPRMKENKHSHDGPATVSRPKRFPYAIYFFFFFHAKRFERNP